MKPTYLSKNLKTLAVAALLATTIQGCIKEDVDTCGLIEVRFRYIKNTEMRDKLASDVDRVNLCVFDGEGIFVDEYSSEGSFLDENYVMRLKLKPDTYTFIVWGNLSDEYGTTPLTRGVSRLEDARLWLRRSSNTVTEFPPALFHGDKYGVEVVSSQQRQIVMIDLMKDNNLIWVIKRGLPLRDRSAGTAFDCFITSTNGDYDFDNSPRSDGGLLKYIPQSEVVEGNILTSNFVILREMNNGSTGSRLIITHTPAGSQPEELLNVPLTPLLVNARQNPLNAGNTGDLDIDDTYILVVDFDYTHQSVTITINGWKAVDGGGGIIG